MTIADDIIAVVQGTIRPLLQNEIWADTYTITSVTSVSDNAGGQTDTPVTIEAGKCRLRAVGTGASGAERITAERLGYATPFAVDLSLDTLLTPGHTLTVNGRVLEVGDVARPGAFGSKVVAVCQEQS